MRLYSVFVFERLCESLRGFTQRAQKKEIRNASLCQNGNFLCSSRLPRLISLDNVNVTDMKCSWKFARLGTNFGTIHSFFLRRPPMAAADNTDSRARTANGPSSLQPSVRWWREGWMGGSYRYLQHSKIRLVSNRLLDIFNCNFESCFLAVESFWQHLYQQLASPWENKAVVFEANGLNSPME